jgi:quercetin dioxygenase-like cupin family protein
MIKHKQYEDLEFLLRDIMKKDKEYIFIQHDFKAGDIVKSHYHPKVNEWVIFSNGKCEVTLGLEKEIIKQPIKGYSVIYLPKGKVHSLKCLTSISYLVLRDGKDKIIYKKTRD